jgi:class 3 adenylate cyclase
VLAVIAWPRRRRDNSAMAACSQCGTALPADAHFCPACAAPVEQRPAPAEERKLATVLFADLVGSTALADSQDPERTRVLLDRFYDAMAAEIERAGGAIEKFVGDAVMAAFGAPAALEDHAERALHAALAMHRRLRELFDDSLALRIGVNTGEVVVGRAREGGSFVTGDVVNVAARLEQAAASGEILVGERTVSAVRGAFEFGEAATVAAKGKTDGVVCRRLVRALSLMRPRGVAGLRPAFIGRENELERLQEAFRSAVSERRPRFVSIVGEAGVGKTRLARELWGWLAEQEPQPLQLAGRCLSHGKGITYWPLAEVLRQHFGILEGDAPEDVADRLGRHPFLGLTLGLGVGQGLHPLVARERLHDSWLQLLDELVEQQPAVLLIEDVHWAEDDLFHLLAALANHVRGPLLLLTTARPDVHDVRPGWGSGPAATVLRIEALADRDTRRLLDEIVGVELPDSLRGVVVERAEGNPFFVEELIATMLDAGALRRDNGGWSFGELPRGFSMPDSVHAVLAARIDLLPSAEKSALQAASVIGRVFWSGPVYELVEGLQPDFDLLEERDFVRRRSGSSLPGEREYVIKHALTREVAYESQPKATRAHRHAAFAAWLERTGMGRDEHAGLLAHHYGRAVRPEDVDIAWPGEDDRLEQLREHAVAWSRRAAQLAVGRYEIEEGLALLHQAVALESRAERQAELWQEIGHANALRFDGEAFRAAMEKAIEIGGPSGELYTELALQTARRSGMWNEPPNRHVVDGWIDRALELAEERSITHAKALAAAALWRRDEAAARALHAIALRLGDVDLRSNALAALTDVAWSAGDMENARGCLEERLQLVPELSDPDDCHFAQMTAVCLYLATARLPEAARACEQLEVLVQGLTPHHRMHAVDLRLHLETVLGRWDVIRELTPKVEQTVKANAAAPCTGNAGALLSCALASVYADDDTESDRLETEAAAQTLGGQRPYYYAHWLQVLLARTDLPGLERLIGSFDLDSVPYTPYRFDLPPAVLDALATLRDVEGIESVAPRWLRPGTYAEPFAIRALGVARNDPVLLDEASRRFETIGLGWRAEETQRWRAEKIVA